jgi:hypothetical protein
MADICCPSQAGFDGVNHRPDCDRRGTAKIEDLIPRLDVDCGQDRDQCVAGAATTSWPALPNGDLVPCRRMPMRQQQGRRLNNQNPDKQ